MVEGKEGRHFKEGPEDRKVGTLEHQNFPLHLLIAEVYYNPSLIKGPYAKDWREEL